MNERDRADRAAIDIFLAHIPVGLSASEGDYNRAEFMPRRRALAQEWADLLMAGMRSAEDVLEGR